LTFSEKVERKVRERSLRKRHAKSVYVFDNKQKKSEEREKNVGKRVDVKRKRLDGIYAKGA